MSNEENGPKRPEYLNCQVNEYILDIRTLPTFLGKDVEERIQNWLKYRELGILLKDSSNA